VARGYYDYDQFHENIIYERVHQLREKAAQKP